MRLTRSFLFLFTILMFSSLTHATEQQDDKAIKLGIFPYVSPGQLVKFHIGLKEMFDKELGKNVVLVTAPDFKEFVKRTKDSYYDFIMTAPHLGRLAEVRDGYRPIAHTMHKVQGVYLVRKSSTINNLNDLNGKVITMVGRTAIITQMVEKQLNSLGLYHGKNITFRFTKTHNNAMYAPLRGESDASVTGIALWTKIGVVKNDNDLKVIGKSPVTIGFQVMASKNVSDRDYKIIEQALFSFHKTEQGKKYMDKTGFNYFDKVDKQEKKDLDPFIQIFLKKN